MKRWIALLWIAALAAPLYAADGAAIFKSKGCVGCHGADGKKELPALGVKPLVSPEIQKQSEAELIAAVSQGKNKMPAFGSKLTPEEIKAVVGFVRSLK